MAEVSERLAPRLLAYFVRRVEPRQDAADLLAQTLTVAWRKLTALPDDSSEVDAWMFTIAANVLANHLRGRMRRDRLAQRLRDEIRRPVDEFEAADLRNDVDAAIYALPTVEAELIRLVYWDGLSATAAGVVLGIPGSTARLRLSTARAALAELLGTAVA